MSGSEPVSITNINQMSLPKWLKGEWNPVMRIYFGSASCAIMYNLNVILSI